MCGKSDAGTGVSLQVARVCAVLLATALPGCGPDNRFEPPPPPEVEVETLTTGPVTTYQSYPGSTTAPEFVELCARVSGFLESVDFAEGSVVEKGTTLFTIEAAPFKAALDEAKGELSTAQANLELAKQNYARNYQLHQKKAIADLELLKFKAEQDKAQAAVAVAQANVEAKQLDLSYTTVKAPFAGRTSQTDVSVGNLVGAGESTLLTTIVRDDPMYVHFEVDERQVVKYLGHRADEDTSPTAQPAIPCNLEFADGTKYEPAGVLDFVDNRVDRDTGTLAMRATFPNEDGRLIPGLFVRILFPEEHPEAITVPNNSLQKDLGGDFVLAVGNDDVVDQRYVNLGPRTGDRRIVESGLEAGERVIVRGIQRARADAAVRPVEATPTPESAD